MSLLSAILLSSEICRVAADGRLVFQLALVTSGSSSSVCSSVEARARHTVLQIATRMPTRWQVGAGWWSIGWTVCPGNETTKTPLSG